MPGIRSASPAWLAIANQLFSVSDAGASEDIGIALYEALEVAPLRVLPQLLRIYGGSIEQLCNVSFEVEKPKQGVRNYKRSIRAKLAAARTKHERALAASCSRGLDLSLATATADGLE